MWFPFGLHAPADISFSLSFVGFLILSALIMDLYSIAELGNIVGGLVSCDAMLV